MSSPIASLKLVAGIYSGSAGLLLAAPALGVGERPSVDPYPEQECTTINTFETLGRFSISGMVITANLQPCTLTPFSDTNGMPVESNLRLDSQQPFVACLAPEEPARFIVQQYEDGRVFGDTGAVNLTPSAVMLLETTAPIPACFNQEG